MLISDIDRYVTEYTQVDVNINNYVAQKMGILLSQTYIKIAEYRLVCVPKTLSMQNATLLTILLGKEIEHYKQFMNALNSLNFTIEVPGKKELAHFFVWGNLKKISPVENKENVYLLEFSFKNSPGSIIEMIGNYLDLRRNLENLFNDYKGKMIEINKEVAKAVELSSVEIGCESNKQKGELLSFSVDQAMVLLPQPQTEIKNCTLYLHFRNALVVIPGTLAQIEADTTGLAKIKFQLQFNPEFVELIDNYFFKNKIKINNP